MARRRPISNRKSRKIFRKGNRRNKKNSLNSTAGPIHRGGIRF